jgi:hypothetical protein
MNGTEARSDEIGRYLDGVRAALADLPDDVRDELLEDLPAHLAEVVSEELAASGDVPAGGDPEAGGAPRALRDRLGSPAEYAAELRAAAGLRPAPGRRRVPPSLTALLARLRGWADEADLRAGRLIGYGRLTEFLPLLRPAWWVARGYVVVVVLFGLPAGMSGIIPGVGGNRPLGAALTLAAIIGSIWLGQLGQRTGGPRRGLPRYATVGANLLMGVLALVALGQFSNAIRDAREAATVVVDDPNSNIIDVIPVGPDGRQLSGVTLLDQNGNELDYGEPWLCQDATQTYVYRYPLCLNPDAVRGAAAGSPPSAVTAPTAPPGTGVGPSPSAPGTATPPVSPAPPSVSGTARPGAPSSASPSVVPSR